MATRFGDLIGPLSWLIQDPPPHAFFILLKLETEIPGMRRQFLLPGAVLRSVVCARADAATSNHQASDASVDFTDNVATVAAIIPSIGYESRGRFSFETSSTTAELVAIDLAPQYLQLLRSPQKEVVIL